MEVYKHEDYNEYRDAQIWKNTGKLKLVWIKKKELNVIVKNIKKNIPIANFGICHGVRNAWEVSQFRKSLGIKVIGTDISYTAERFDSTIEWDFHNVKDEWVDAVDFIYSNSFDHSYDPPMCLDKWMSCIKKTGVCYIHWNHENEIEGAIDAADCFNATAHEYRDLFNKKYKVVEEFAPLNTNRIVFAVQHKE